MAELVNETLNTINKRHSTRMFNPEPVSNEQLEIILNAANRAPSAHNEQAWRFIVVRGERKAGLADLIHQHSYQFPRASASLLRMAAKSIISAPVVIVVANSGELIRRGKDLFQLDDNVSHDFFRTMEIQSSSAAAENLLLAATSIGLASVWLGIMFLIKDLILEYLDEPKGEFMAVIPVGHPEKVTHSPKKRPLAMVVRYEG